MRALTENFLQHENELNNPPVSEKGYDFLTPLNSGM